MSTDEMNAEERIATFGKFYANKPHLFTFFPGELVLINKAISVAKDIVEASARQKCKRRRVRLCETRDQNMAGNRFVAATVSTVNQPSSFTSLLLEVPTPITVDNRTVEGDVDADVISTNPSPVQQLTASIPASQLPLLTSATASSIYRKGNNLEEYFSNWIQNTKNNIDYRPAQCKIDLVKATIVCSTCQLKKVFKTYEYGGAWKLSTAFIQHLLSCHKSTTIDVSTDTSSASSASFT